MAGRLALVVGLGFHDHSARRAVRHHAPEQVACHLHHRTRVEIGLEAPRRCRAQGETPSASRASSICCASRAEDVPPSESLDSSHERCARTS